MADCRKHRRRNGFKENAAVRFDALNCIITPQNIQYNMEEIFPGRRYIYWNERFMFTFREKVRLRKRDGGAFVVKMRMTENAREGGRAAGRRFRGRMVLVENGY